MFTNSIDPVIVDFGFLTIYWYGIFLGIGVGLALMLASYIFRKEKLDPNEAMRIAIWLIVGGLIGARLGHIIFYNLDFYLSSPAEILMINHGGLSSHGLAIGLILSYFLNIKIRKINWKKYTDLLVISIPLFAGFVRIGNFFNSEIVGKQTSLPWAVKFEAVDQIMRHPSQVYEALIAFCIFGILFIIWKQKRAQSPLLITNIFIFLYFSSRFLIEFVKEYQILESGLTMGQWLSIPFILFSVIFFIFEYKK